MKDLEKIKSEDLGCQVADANPGNFGIEQEVAAMVGATVPAPTEPSADDARELGAQLLVFLRRALTPIQSALRTALAAIYAHLDSRCTDYTPAAYAPYQPLPSYDPMGTPPTPRTLPNLLTAITAFSARKISNGSATNDGIPDGVSLAHLLCDTTAAGAVTILQDDNKDDWSLTTPSRISTIAGLFPNAKTIHVGCSKITSSVSLALSTVEHLYFDNATEALNLSITGGCYYHIPKVKKIETTSIVLNGWVNPDGKVDWPEVEYVNSARVAWTSGYPTEIIAPKLKDFYNTEGIFQASSVLPTTRMVFGTLVRFPSRFLQSNSSNLMSNLIDFEVGQGTAINLNLSQWGAENVLSDADKTATFLQNFKEHIALRLTSNGSGKTLTLSQAVFDTIWNQDGTPKSTDPDSVIYQINKIIKTDKHWSVNRA